MSCASRNVAGCSAHSVFSIAKNGGPKQNTATSCQFCVDCVTQKSKTRSLTHERPMLFFRDSRSEHGVLLLQASSSTSTSATDHCWTNTSTLCCSRLSLEGPPSFSWKSSSETTSCWSFSAAAWPSCKEPGFGRWGLAVRVSKALCYSPKG